MAETSKNKIYYNDDENSAADVLTDMKKLAQSTDDAIEKSKYDDTQIKKDISNMKTEIAAKDNEQDNKILQLQNEKAELEKELKEAQEDFYQNSIRGQASGEYIHVEDSSNCRAKIGIGGNSKQETSPSPDYPSPVKTVGSNVNIFDLESYYNIVPSANCTKQLLKNGIRLNFTAGNDAYIGGVYNIGTTMAENQKAACIKVKPNTTYTLKMSSAPNCYMSFLDKDYKAVKAFVNISSNEYVFSTDSSTEYIYLRLGYQNRTSGLTSYDFTDIKCVEGTEATPYSKYGQGCVKVTKCNKNLINKNLLTNYQILEDTGKLLFNNTRLITPFIYLKKGTYSLSCNLSRFAYAIYNLDKSFNSFVTWKAFPNQIVLNSDCYIKIEFIINPTGSEQVSIKDITYLQLEKGTTTSYEEHQEETYIMPVQQEMLEGDYFDFDNEEEVHTWGKYEFTGEEAFSIAFNSNYYVIYTQGNFINNFDYNETVETYKCSHFKSIAVNTRYQNNTFFININRNLTFTTLKYSTVTDFKTWLKSLYDAGTPVTVYYKLATPTKLAFAEEQKAVAKELNNARTYKNVTNITTDSKAILSLDYAKDLETLLTSKESEV